MAAIDKLYGTHKEYQEFRDWCEKHFPDAVRYFYDWNWNDDLPHAMTLFPTLIDMRLLQICPIEWVVQQIKEQYDME